MKVNPKVLTLCLMILLSINLMKAQSNNPDKHAERQIEKLTTDLALSETQVSQLTEILTAHTAKVKAVKNAETERGAAKETIKTLRDEKDTAIKGILNTEQATKYTAIKKEGKGKRGKKGRKGKRGDGHKGGATTEERAQHHTDRLVEKLALTETQTTEAAKINFAFAQKIKATKDAETERGENREAVNILKTEQKTAIKAVLNPEQMTTFETMKDDRKGKRGHGHKGTATPEERAQHHTARLAEELALTETQTTEVADINLAFAKKIKATKEAETERGENRETVNTLKTEQKAAIKAVLTPEQMTTFEAMKRGPKGRRGKEGSNCK